MTDMHSDSPDSQAPFPSHNGLSHCSEVRPGLPSGVYRITSPEGYSFDMFCDVDTPEGPWTVVQRRINEEVDFYRNWAEYKNGFGNLNGNFWIGNDILHFLTNTPRVLRIELEAWNGTKAYAQYSAFHVANEDHKYTLHVDGFSGNVPNDAMDTYDNIPFTTYDRDHDMYDQNCAFRHRGAWWHRSCTKSNLNGEYHQDNGENNPKAIFWRNFFTGRLYAPLKRTVMMIH